MDQVANTQNIEWKKEVDSFHYGIKNCFPFSAIGLFHTPSIKIHRFFLRVHLALMQNVCSFIELEILWTGCLLIKFLFAISASYRKWNRGQKERARSCLNWTKKSTNQRKTFCFPRGGTLNIKMRAAAQDRFWYWDFNEDSNQRNTAVCWNPTVVAETYSWCKTRNRIKKCCVFIDPRR